MISSLNNLPGEVLAKFFFRPLLDPNECRENTVVPKAVVKYPFLLQLLKPSPVFEEALLFYRTVARQFIYYLLMVGRNDVFDNTRRVGFRSPLLLVLLSFFSALISFQRERAMVQPPLLYNSPFTVDNFTFSLYRWSVGTVTTRINLIPSETARAANGAAKMVSA